MLTATPIKAQQPAETQSTKGVLDELCREGARQMLQAALQAEVRDYIESHGAEIGPDGRRLVIGNGYLPERELMTGLGPLKIRQPRVRDERPGKRFSSQILPPYLRRTPSIEALVPALYLKGISTGDFPAALEAILGPDAAGLSATSVVRLKKVWEEDYEQWRQRDLSNKHYVYVWADGIHFNVRLEDDRTCMLVLIGALEDGTKELIAVWDGFRESKDSWLDVLRDLRRRGLERPPKLAVGDGALGFWGALAEVFPKTRRQRCWVHKTANVLDKMPKRLHSRAKSMLHEMYLASTRKMALEAYDAFLDAYSAKYPKACDCLVKDFEDLFAFYDFPAEHWIHIRTTNPIESTFATVRLRTRRTKGCGSTKATLTMVFKLGIECEKKWRRLNGSARIAQVVEGRRFIDGVLEGEKAA